MLFFILGLSALAFFLYAKGGIDKHRFPFIYYASNKYSSYKRLFLIITFMGGLFFLTRSFLISAAGFAALVVLYALLSSAGIKFKNEGGAGSKSKEMTRKEALQILGLEENCNRKEILKAHRDLIKKLHPDIGGTSYLTSLVNEAKEILLSD